MHYRQARKDVRFSALLHHIDVEFLGFSYGFRRGCSQHDALDTLSTGIYRKRVNWVLDADIQGFFDAMEHDWILRFLQHRIADKRLLRLITKWLKVGTIHEGRHELSSRGTPKGAVISPILAKYVFFTQVRWYWLRALKRRSQKAYLSWKAFERRTTRFFPPIRLLHSHPAGRFDARTRRRSPVR